MDAHVEPRTVMTKAADGLEIHNQLFLPKDLKPGERRPAIVFVHGGPARQMLPGYHYMQFYHWSYAHQSVAGEPGLRRDVGELPQRHRLRPIVPHGAEHRRQRQRRVSGRAGRRQVPADARGRRSEARRDLGTVVRRRAHRRRRSRATPTSSRPASISPACTSGAARSIPRHVSYKSSAIGAIDGWKSPVLLVHGDDDRNVAFPQTTGSCSCCAQRDIYYELIVFPDDTHESMLHSRWMYTLDRMETFLEEVPRTGQEVDDREPAEVTEGTRFTTKERD